MDTIAEIAIKDLVIPELISFIRGFHAAGGTLPTSEQVVAEYEANRLRYLGAGQAFLARTGTGAGPAVPAPGV